VSRVTGALIIGAYLVFLGSLLATANAASPDPRLTVFPLVGGGPWPPGAGWPAGRDANAARDRTQQ
jgi:hypothetical protein